MENTNKLLQVISMISEYQNPGKKALQKLIYLVEKKGMDLGFDYSIHYYGPYSSSLDDALHSLQMQGEIEVVPDGMSHRIHLTELRDSTDNVLISQGDLKSIDSVLGVFGSMSAFELEIITTTDYVARELCRSENRCSDENIIEGVKKIKGDKFTIEKIYQTIALLRENGYRWN